jgi:MATE family, multidrug efflux pump
MNIGVMSLIGRFVGAGDMNRANQVIASGFTMALSYSTVLAVIFLIYRTELVALFDNGSGDFSEIVELGSYMMIGLVTYMLADACILISGGALRGAGDTRWIMITSVSVHIAMLVVQYLVIVVFKYEAIVSWWVFVVMLLTLAVLYLSRLFGGVWRAPERLARVLREY